MMKNFKLLFGLSLLGVVLSAFGEAAKPLPKAHSNILTLNEERRLEAKISADFMNRIAVMNDRIVNVFGDEGTFVAQTDDATGQVFIKPTAENMVQPLSITLITENGITQDLTLTPKKSNATTLILKPRVAPTHPANQLLPTGLPNLQDEWLSIMKQAVLGELMASDTKVVAKRKVAGFSMHYLKGYQTKNYMVQVWLIKNNTKELKKLEEETFFKPGDLALSLQKHSLEPNDKTMLYILGAI